MALNPTTGNKRSTGVASGNNQLQRYSGTLFNQLKSANVSTYQPHNANLDSISAINGSATGIVTDASGTFGASTLTLNGDVSASISTTTTAVTLATVNSNVGTFQGLTVNGKGLVTAAASLFVTAPAHNTSTGVQGQWSWDSTYFYICVATNSWGRIALLTTW